MHKCGKRKDKSLADLKRDIPKGGLLNPVLRVGFGRIPTKKDLYGK